MSRIAKRFDKLKAEGRGGLVTFITAGDPDRATSAAILAGLPAAGADLIELGMPFTDPMADGPAIQLAGQRALAAGSSLDQVFGMVADFRKTDAETPIILMGYYNSIYARGPQAFCAQAKQAGVDGLILVDLPPEEAEELVPHAQANGIDFIVLTAPTSDDARLPAILRNASGFIYYVSIAGITGTASASRAAIEQATARIKGHTSLPVAVGFGIKTAEQAAEVSSIAEAAVVGSAIVQKVADNLDADGKATPGLVPAVLTYVGDLARAVRAAKVTA